MMTFALQGNEVWMIALLVPGGIITSIFWVKTRQRDEISPNSEKEKEIAKLLQRTMNAANISHLSLSDFGPLIVSGYLIDRASSGKYFIMSDLQRYSKGLWKYYTFLCYTYPKSHVSEPTGANWSQLYYTLAIQYTCSS